MPASYKKHNKRQRYNSKPEMIPVKFSRSLFVSRKIRLTIGCLILLALILYPFLRIKKTQADEIFLYPDVCNDSGSEIVVDRTIDGAAKLVNLLGGNTKNQTATSFTIVNGDSQITNLLNKMRMFMISGNEVSY